MHLAERQTEGQPSGYLISIKIVSGTGMFKDGDLVGKAFSQVCQSRSGPVRWKGLIDQFDPVPHRDGGARFQMQLATNVGGGDAGGATGAEAGEFVVAQAAGEFRLQQGIAARGTAAKVAVRYRRQFEAQLDQDALNQAGQFLAMLQAAWGMEGDALATGGCRRPRLALDGRASSSASTSPGSRVRAAIRAALAA